MEYENELKKFEEKAMKLQTINSITQKHGNQKLAPLARGLFFDFRFVCKFGIIGKVNPSVSTPIK